MRSDHQPLKWLFSLRDPSGQVARWLEFLSQFDFSVEYRKGTKHLNAEEMSRNVPYKCECEDDDSSLPSGPCVKCERNTRVDEATRHTSTNDTSDTEASHGVQYSSTQLRQFQETDADIAPVLLWTSEKESRPDIKAVVFHSPVTRNLWLSWEMLQIKDGVLYKLSKQGHPCLVVPTELKSELLNLMHSSLLTGHFRLQENSQQVETKVLLVPNERSCLLLDTEM